MTNTRLANRHKTEESFAGELALRNEHALQKQKTIATQAAPRRLYRHKDVNSGALSFAAGLNVYKAIWVFIIGSVLGVLTETLAILFTEGIFLRTSGMLYGPFNQIYGLGAVLFTLALYRLREKSALLIFSVSALAGGAFEFVCSWVQQAVFGSVSWEYSDMPANICGRTNLFYMAGWGLMGLLFIGYFWPFLSEMIERIPNKMATQRKVLGKQLRATGKGLTLVCLVVLMLNLALTALAVWRAGERALGKPADTALVQWVDEAYPDDVMQEKFPTMEFVE